jgi:hypothetical protein
VHREGVGGSKSLPKMVGRSENGVCLVVREDAETEDEQPMRKRMPTEAHRSSKCGGKGTKCMIELIKRTTRRVGQN